MSQGSRRRTITARSGRGRRPARALSRGVRLLLGLALVVLFGIGLALGVEMSKPPPRPDLEQLKIHPPPPPPAPPPVAVAPPEDDGVVLRSPPPPRGERPRLAVVVDDLGRSVAVLDRLAEIGVPLTYSVLPYESRTPEVVAYLRARGAELLCHLPMEARGGVSAGPGALRRDMTRAELIAATERALAAVPGAVGANNHMGSEISADRQAMRTVLEVLAERGLYYLDSRTTPDTLGYTVARQLGMAAGERQVFLDVERDPAAISAQFEAALAAARQRGGAIVIAHPYPETLEVLARELPRARAQGFELVTASALLDRPQSPSRSTAARE
ncbi:MAG: divergent polysaccharide deacetylase family protein [Acidobacteria bacterium]|nr:MAG: divergent polysaccharide deacetylase family protein [Acidobacteriota bacterium]